MMMMMMMMMIMWRRNRSDLTWNSYVQLRSVTQEVYAFAEREYNHGIKETLLGATQPRKWWSTLKSALFGVDDGMPPLLKPDGSLTLVQKKRQHCLPMSLMESKVTKY